MKSLLTSLLLCIAFCANAQVRFDVPQDITLETDADYEKYEADVIKAAKWLEATDLDKETEKRQEVNAFVLQWVSGSKTVSVDITDALGKLYDKNTQLLGIYLAAYARYSLEHKEAAAGHAATKAGIQAMIRVYKKGKAISKSKEMEQAIAAEKNNKLDDYINEKFSTE